MARSHTHLICLLATLVASLGSSAARAADAAACTGFKWDVSHEVALMQGSAAPVAAGQAIGSSLPQLKLDMLYSVKLADQAAVKFALTPGKNGAVAGAYAGLVQFRVTTPGRYRISITSRHWIDIVSGGQLVPSIDFQGHAGCERPRKIVEFDLPAAKPLILQFSGSSDQEVSVAITAAKAAS